jgi:transposase
VQRTILWDNLAAHFTDNIAIDLLEEAGHRVVARPAYSSDFAPIESAFGKMKEYLRMNVDSITYAGFREAIEAAVLTLTASDCEGYFQNCHYFVHGRAYKPYLGVAPK